MSAKTLLKSLVKRSSKKAVAISLFSLSSFTLASPSFAASLDVGSWTRSGDVSQTPGQATLTNAISPNNPLYPDDLDNSKNPINYNVSGSEPTGINALETFLGVTQGRLGNDPGSNATEGSAIKTILPNIRAGDIFSFNWNSDLLDSIDRFFVTINDSVSPLTTGNFFSYTFNADGNYNIGIGIVDVNDTSVSSRLVVSNANLEPVPEPLTILGSLTAFGFGASLQRRFRKKA